MKSQYKKDYTKMIYANHKNVDGRKIVIICLSVLVIYYVFFIKALKNIIDSV